MDSNIPREDQQDAQQWAEEDAVKPNKNCLQGMRCPKCQSYEPFRITVSTTVLMYDDGTEDDQMGGDQDWDETSYCECGECSYHATVADFCIKEETPHDDRTMPLWS